MKMNKCSDDGGNLVAAEGFQDSVFGECEMDIRYENYVRSIAEDFIANCMAGDFPGAKMYLEELSQILQDVLEQGPGVVFCNEVYLGPYGDGFI